MTHFPIAKLTRACLCLAALNLCWSGSTLANERAPTPSGSSLEARGNYRYVYKFFFKLYDIELFAAPNAKRAEILDADVSIKLEFLYHRTINKSIIIDSAGKMLARNLSPMQLALISERVSAINSAYTTVNQGDRSSLHYQPEIGTTLNINGRDIITIPGADFAQHYFKIWLGPQPISASMKAALLE